MASAAGSAEFLGLEVDAGDAGVVRMRWRITNRRTHPVKARLYHGEAPANSGATPVGPLLLEPASTPVTNLAWNEFLVPPHRPVTATLSLRIPPEMGVKVVPLFSWDPRLRLRPISGPAYSIWWSEGRLTLVRLPD